MKSKILSHLMLVAVVILILCALIPLSVTASSQLVLDFNEIEVAEAIKLLAKNLHINVILSPAISGVISLHLTRASTRQALEMIIATHGLAKWQRDKLWYIAPRNELIKRRQEEFKLIEISTATSSLHTQLWQIKYAKAADVVKLIRDKDSSLLSRRGHLSIDERTNIICVEDINLKLRLINELIKKVDIPIRQISIVARLASVDSDYERELGINFVIKSAKNVDNNFESGLGTAERGYSLVVSKLADGSLLDVKLAALENAGHAELISNPSLFTSDQQTASIESGEEVPYQEVSEGGGTAIVFKKAVLGLKVTPHILPGNKVLLLLQINQDRPSNKTVLGMPTISTRQIVTNVLVKNGQTIVLGGIYETNNEKGWLGLPFISQIPLVGLLFKQQVNRINKRELLIFVTPEIIA